MDRSNLIVNYLPSGFTEDDLQELFGSFGSILSIKVVRDKSTGISMGFGFVNFESNSSAAAALSSLNGKMLREDKLMKVSVARPAWKANIHSNLYISGFPISFVESDVLDFLGVHATGAENVRLLRDANKNPRGAVVVRMSSEEAASGVISSLNGIPIKSKAGTSVIQVRAWRPEFRVDRVSDENIMSSFAWNGRAMDASKPIVRNPAPLLQPPVPVAYPDAQDLLQRMAYQHRLHQMPQATCTPETLNTDEEDENLATLFVFHLPSDVCEDALRQVFSQFGGQIESLQVMRNKGYGFISFYRTLDAVVAMERLNGISLDGGRKHIRIELKQ